MTDDQSIELEAAKSPLIRDVIDRLDQAGVDWHNAELRMGYVRKSTPLLGDIRAAAVIAIDSEGHAAEVVHMPLDDVDPLVIDAEVINRVLARELADYGIGYATTERIARQIVDALRAGTITKEN